MNLLLFSILIMKFSNLVVLAACTATPVASFVHPQHRVQVTRTSFVKPLYAIEDLEAKLLGGGDQPKKGAKKAAAPAPTPAKPSSSSQPKAAATEKLEIPKYESFTGGGGSTEAPKKLPLDSPRPSKVESKPKPAPVVKEAPKPAPVKAAAPAPKPAPPAPVKAPPAPKKVAVVPPRKAVVTKPKPPPKAPVKADPNAVPLGVALGAAPLLLAPLVALGAGRSVLAGTAARREKIQEEIAAREAAKKKKVAAEVDGGALTSAVVRSMSVSNVVVLAPWSKLGLQGFSQYLTHFLRVFTLSLRFRFDRDTLVRPVWLWPRLWPIPLPTRQNLDCHPCHCHRSVSHRVEDRQRKQSRSCP